VEAARASLAPPRDHAATKAASTGDSVLVHVAQFKRDIEAGAALRGLHLSSATPPTRTPLTMHQHLACITSLQPLPVPPGRGALPVILTDQGGLPVLPPSQAQAAGMPGAAGFLDAMLVGRK